MKKEKTLRHIPNVYRRREDRNTDRGKEVKMNRKGI